MGEGQMFKMKHDLDPNLCHPEDLKDRVNDQVCENRRFTTDDLHEVFPYVLLFALYKIVIVQLCFRQICAKWLPRMFTDEYKPKK
jgi:hypothetical protein